MANINTLEYFDNLVRAGVSEREARANVENLNSSLDHLATKEDLNLMAEKIERNLKIFFGYIIGGTFLATILIPILVAIFLKLTGIS